MAQTLTLYQIPQIGRNMRMVNSYAMQNLLSVSSSAIKNSYDVNLLSDTPIQPNVPFYFTCDNVELPALAQCNYFYWNRSSSSSAGTGRYYYAIIDSIEVSNVDNSVYTSIKKYTYKCTHHIDIFAQYGCGLPFIPNNMTESARTTDPVAIGTMTRGHVNDVIYHNEKICPTMKYTFQTPEEGINAFSRYYKRVIGDSNGLGDITISGTTYSVIAWLYIYYANPRLFADTTHLSSQYQELSYSNAPVNGWTCVYPLVKDAYNRLNALGLEPASQTGTVLMPISAMTHEAITSMMILPFNPYNCTPSEWRSKVTSDVSLVEGNVISFYISESDMMNLINLPCTFDFCPFDFSNVTPEGYPIFHDDSDLPYDVSSSTEWDNYSLYTDGDGDTYMTNTMAYVSTLPNASMYTKYIESCIVKTHTSPYQQIYINNLAQSSLLWSGTVNYMVDPTLSTLILQIPHSTCNTEYTISYATALSNFAPSATLDYWSRLNATQESISAQQDKFNAQASGVASLVSAMTSAMTFNFAGAINGIANTAKSMGSAYYTTEYANNAMEIAQHQYDCGETNEGGALGIANTVGWHDSPYVVYVTLSQSEGERISRLLHEKGYNCSVPLRDMKLHQRLSFNYVQCSDYTRNDVSADVAEEFRRIYAEGVWIFSRSVSASQNPLDNPNPPIRLEEGEIV